jgi:hypothetical protein
MIVWPDQRHVALGPKLTPAAAPREVDWPPQWRPGAIRSKVQALVGSGRGAALPVMRVLSVEPELERRPPAWQYRNGSRAGGHAPCSETRRVRCSPVGEGCC